MGSLLGGYCSKPIKNIWELNGRVFDVGATLCGCPMRGNGAVWLVVVTWMEIACIVKKGRPHGAAPTQSRKSLNLVVHPPETDTLRSRMLSACYFGLD